MFENLTDRLSQTLRNVTGKAKLTEDNIKDTLREVRMALLEADVALPVVKDFVAKVKDRAVGTEVSKSLTPGQAFVKIVRAELEELMGAANEDLALNAAPPAVVLMAGLQGAGKTTTPASWPSSSRSARRSRCCWCRLTSIARRQSSSWKPWQVIWVSPSSLPMPARSRWTSPMRRSAKPS